MRQDIVGAAGSRELRSPVPRLTDLQWQVIRLAVRECPGKIRTRWGARLRSLLPRYFGARLGWRARQPLANDCLEALRQYVCLSKEQDPAALEQVVTILSNDLDKEQIQAIAAFVGGTDRFG